MPMKADAHATQFEEIDRFEGGVGWIAHPEETMERASHLVVSGGDVWVIDPVDADGIDDLVAEFGDVRGVVVLLDRHTRDAASIARRYDVPVFVPSFVTVDVPVETVSFSERLPDSEYEVFEILDWPGWTEAALYDGDTLVVPEALGGNEYSLAGRERIGVHPALRLTPPKTLKQFSPGRILTGHGSGILEDGTDALEYALNGARSRAPRVWLNGLKTLV